MLFKIKVWFLKGKSKNNLKIYFKGFLKSKPNENILKIIVKGFLKE